VKGFSQQEGIEYNDTLSHVANIIFAWMILSLSTHFGCVSTKIYMIKFSHFMALCTFVEKILKTLIFVAS
jgi:hypothetical protein